MCQNRSCQRWDVIIIVVVVVVDDGVAVVDSINRHLKFCQNRVSYRWYIADIDSLVGRWVVSGGVGRLGFEMGFDIYSSLKKLLPPIYKTMKMMYTTRKMKMILKIKTTHKRKKTTKMKRRPGCQYPYFLLWKSWYISYYPIICLTDWLNHQLIDSTSKLIGFWMGS